MMVTTSDDLLSYGTWAQYKESNGTDLTAQQETQLKSLTVRNTTVVFFFAEPSLPGACSVAPSRSQSLPVAPSRSQSLPVAPSRLIASSAVMQVVTLCQNRSVVPYAELQAATGTASVKELEHLIIHHCIYSGLLAAKLDQRTQQLRVFKSAPRKVSPVKLDRMISSLSSWLDRARDVSRFLDGVGRDLDEEAEKAAAAGRAKALALLAAKKDRELTMLMKGKQSGAEGDVDLDGEGVPMKTDMMASTKKSKRQKKRQMDVRGDAHPDTTEQEADD